MLSKGMSIMRKIMKVFESRSVVLSLTLLSEDDLR